MRKDNKTRDAYFRRLAKIKSELPDHGVTSLVAKLFPQYDTPAGRRRVGNVLNNRVQDDDVLIALTYVSDGVRIARDVKNMAAMLPNDETFGGAVREYLGNVGR